MTVSRLPYLDSLFSRCEFCGSRPVVEKVVDGQHVRYQVRCPMEDDGVCDRHRSLALLKLMWMSSQHHRRRLRNNLLI